MRLDYFRLFSVEVGSLVLVEVNTDCCEALVKIALVLVWGVGRTILLGFRYRP